MMFFKKRIPKIKGIISHPNIWYQRDPIKILLQFKLILYWSIIQQQKIKRITFWLYSIVFLIFLSFFPIFLFFLFYFFFFFVFFLYGIHGSDTVNEDAKDRNGLAKRFWLSIEQTQYVWYNTTHSHIVIAIINTLCSFKFHKITFKR